MSERSAFRRFFSSLELTIVLLVMLCLLLTAGTIIPQQEAAREFLAHLPPQTASFLRSMQIFDLYHSVWLFVLFALLSVNLVCCSLERLPHAWRRFRGRVVQKMNVGAGVEVSQMVVIEGKKREAVVGKLVGALKGSYRLEVQQDDGITTIRGDRGRVAHLGVYIVHLGVLILVVGFATGAFFSIEGYVNIGEGETVHTVDLKGGLGRLDLPFAVRCERFVLEHYPDGTPKTYRSDLSFLENGVVSRQASLLVNHPISFAGFRFYQASYGLTPDGRAELSYQGPGARKGKAVVSEGEGFVLFDGRTVVEVLRVEENLMHMGPAVKLQVRSPDREVSFWVFKEIERMKAENPGLTQQVPIFDPGLFKPYVFILHGVSGRYYPGIQVARDPGVPLVAGGGMVLFIGLMVTFFVVHRRILVRIVDDGGVLKMYIEGSAHRSHVSMDGEVQSLIRSMEKSAGDEG
ncbi:MAG: cytochrome c biogenesis protein ResB [Syntrophales bacterium]|nr:cytochrome c biogenesis protein ResB [Syntrophales bacterium]